MSCTGIRPGQPRSRLESLHRSVEYLSSDSGRGFPFWLTRTLDSELAETMAQKLQNEHAGLSVTVNGQATAIELGESISSLLQRLEMSHRGIAVEVNQKVVSRDQHADHKLSDGDWLEIVTLVGGG